MQIGPYIEYDPSQKSHQALSTETDRLILKFILKFKGARITKIAGKE